MANNINKLYHLAERAKKLLLAKDDENVQSADKDFAELLSLMQDEESMTKEIELMREGYANRDTQLLLKQLKERGATKKSRGGFIFKLGISVAAVMLLSLYILSTSTEGRRTYIAKVSPNAYKYDKPVIVSSEETVVIDNMDDESKMYEILQTNNAKVVNYSNASRIMGIAAANSKIIVPTGYTQSVILSDGTEVTINSESELTFPAEFTGNKRTVELIGEAYFKVKKSDKPFIVDVGGTFVKVYGTEFNINEFNGRVATVLVSGSVGVCLKKSGSKEVIIEPGQLITNDEQGRYEIESVDTKSYTSWLNSDFDYRDTPLCDVLTDLSRWYGINIELSEEVDDNILVSLYSRRDVKKDDVFKLLELTNGLLFLNEGGGKYRLEVEK